MTRFRRSGRNWEGRSWRTASSLNALMDEIEAAFPEPHAADGTVASKSHDQLNPFSDHRPYPYTGSGVVHAVDFGENRENDAFKIVEAIRLTQDRRVNYVIHEGRLFSSYQAGAIRPFFWRPYTGPNPHLNHGHVSVLRSNATDQRPWNLGLVDMPLTDEDKAFIIQAVENGLISARAAQARAVWSDFPGIPQSQGGPSAYQTHIRTSAQVNAILLQLARIEDLAELTETELAAISDAVADEIFRRGIE